MALTRASPSDRRPGAPSGALSGAQSEMLNIGPQELLVILVIALIVVGATSIRNERWTSSFARRSSARLAPSEREMFRISSAGSGSEAVGVGSGATGFGSVERRSAEPEAPRAGAGVAELPFGGSSSRLTWIVRFTSSCALRSSRNPRPIDRPSAGRR